MRGAAGRGARPGGAAPCAPPPGFAPVGKGAVLCRAPSAFGYPARDLDPCLRRTLCSRSGQQRHSGGKKMLTNSPVQYL